MYLLLAEEYKNPGVHFSRVRKTGEIWVSIKNVHNGLGVKNMPDLVLKEICNICKTKNLANKQIRKYKITEKETFEKYANLSEDELSEKK